MNPTNLLVPPKLQVWVLSSSNTNVKFNVCNTRLSVHTHNGRFGDHLSDILRPVQRNGAPHLDERSDTGPLQKGDRTVNHNLFCLDFIGHMTLLKWRQSDYAINLQSYDTHINLFGICIQDQLLVIKAVSSSWFNDLLGNFNKNVVLLA